MNNMMHKMKTDILPEEHPLVQEVIHALRQVYDPEIHVNLYDLGLIYHLDVYDDGDVEIAMTLTAPGCPVAGEIVKMVETAVRSVEGTKNIVVELVWEPPWNKSMMTEEAKLELDMF